MVKLKGLKEEDITESMISKWDELIRYERKKKPETVLGFDLDVKGEYHLENRDIDFIQDIHLSVKTSRNVQYVKDKVVCLEGIKELREVRNFYSRLKEALGLEEDVYITVKSIKLKG